MDELMPHDMDDHHLDVIPYYVVGNCFMKNKELKRQSSGPIWRNTKRVKRKITEEIPVLIINTSGAIKIGDSEEVLTMWLEYKTDLIKK